MIDVGCNAYIWGFHGNMNIAWGFYYIHTSDDSFACMSVHEYVYTLYLTFESYTTILC